MCTEAPLHIGEVLKHLQGGHKGVTGWCKAAGAAQTQTKQGKMQPSVAEVDAEWGGLVPAPLWLIPAASGETGDQ